MMQSNRMRCLKTISGPLNKPPACHYGTICPVSCERMTQISCVNLTCSERMPKHGKQVTANIIFSCKEKPTRAKNAPLQAISNLSGEASQSLDDQLPTNFFELTR
ncbi:MAG: hypothetical protein CMJ80_18040 [Planctomycetaceae bacterium]|nr:hypothetical protein [Planctomycetaceae bacterium]